MSARTAREGPPLQRIWAQHAELHRRVRALSTWVEDGGPRMDEARALLEEIRRALPEHFALEEQGGYFSDVLSVAPHLGARAETLRSHHAQLIPQLQAAIDHLPPEGESARNPAASIERIAAFVAALEDHERGENELVKEAFRGGGERPAERGPKLFSAP